MRILKNDVNKIQADVAKYLDSFPNPMQKRLKMVRKALFAVAPKAEERMKYGVPAVIQEGSRAILYAGFREHIGIYPGPEAIRAFHKELVVWNTSKGTIRFPHTEQMPLELIACIAKFVFVKE